MKQNKCPRNSKKQAHGLWIWYYANDKIILKGQYINNVEYGHWIENWNNDTHKITFYIK